MSFNRGTKATISPEFDQKETSSPDKCIPRHSTSQPQKRTDGIPRSKLASSKGELDISSLKEFKLQELAMLSLNPIIRSVQRWWLQHAERHYLICADVEQQRAREAQMNVAYYQKRAALARSARN